MTWNRRITFSRTAQTAPGAEASASFDPSRTGDPSPGASSAPAFGVGYAGRAGGAGESGRNPIGFAPPTDPERDLSREPRFQTEISFKRHQAPVMPLASAHAGGGPGDEHEAGASDPGWQVPADVTPAGNAPAMEEPSMVEEPMAADEQDGAAEKAVPFYKRELSFRRRKAEPETVTTETSVVGETAVVEEPQITAEPEIEEAVLAVLAAPVEPESAPEAALDADISDSSPGELESVIVAAEEPAVVDAPHPEQSAAEAPSPDAPLATAPEPDEPAADTPETEAPVADTPVADAVPGKSTNGGRPFSRKRGAGSAAAPARKQGRGGRGRKVVGLKIGASQIAAAVINETDGSNELVQLVRRPIDSGLVVDGEVRDPEALANVLKAFFDENDLPKKDVRIGLASNRIGVRTFDIAGIDDETRFDNAVRFKAHEVLPVAQHESVLDYRVLAESSNEAGETSRRILLVVAPRDQVEPYLNVAQQAGIRLTGVDLEALSLLRAFVDPKPFAVRAVDDTATVIVSIGHESTTLLVAGGGVCEFTRVFDWGGGTLQDAVTQELGVHPAEAATILRHLSLAGPGRMYETLDDAARAKAIEAVRLRLTPFARELVSSLQFYQTQPDSLGIGEIVITGGTSHLEGLGEALNQMIGVSVRVGDPLGRVRVSAEIDPAVEVTIGSMAVPIGLAIEDEGMRMVNLLPADAKVAARKMPSRVAVALPIAVAIPVAALGFMFVSAHGQVSDSQAELDAISAELAALPQPQRAVIDVSLKGEQADRAQAVANVLGTRVAWDAVLRDVSRVLPENVWLNSLQAQATPTAAAGAVPVAATSTPGVQAPPTGAQIDGYTYAQTDVARLLARLATLPSLRNVTLTSSTVETKGSKTVVHFQIAADLNTGGS